MNTNTKESGFFDLPQEQRCTHINHNPPSHIAIPMGKGYRHICPSCKTEFIIVPPQISYRRNLPKNILGFDGNGKQVTAKEFDSVIDKVSGIDDVNELRELTLGSLFALKMTGEYPESAFDSLQFTRPCHSRDVTEGDFDWANQFKSRKDE